MHPLLRMIGFFALVFTIVVLFVFLAKWIVHLRRRNGFPRRTFHSALIGFAVCSGIFVYLQYFFSFDAIDRSHKQEGPAISSPAGAYTARAYYEPYGGAAGGVNVWVEVDDHAEHTTRTIYYADAKTNIALDWTSEDTLAITNAGEDPASDRSAVLRVATDIYDENGRACRSLLMKKEYQECYRSENH